MNEYETIFVLRPDSPESKTSQLLEKLNGIIERHSGTMLQDQNWGKKDLAYMVQKNRQGFYYYYNYAGDAGVVKDLERTLRLNEFAMKFLTVKLADEVDVEARKSEIAKAKEETAPVATPEAEKAADPVVAKTEVVANSEVAKEATDA